MHKKTIIICNASHFEVEIDNGKFNPAYPRQIWNGAGCYLAHDSSKCIIAPDNIERHALLDVRYTIQVKRHALQTKNASRIVRCVLRVTG